MVFEISEVLLNSFINALLARCNKILYIDNAIEIISIYNRLQLTCSDVKIGLVVRREDGNRVLQ